MGGNELHFRQFFWLLLIACVATLAARKVRVPSALALVITGLAIGIPRLMPQVHLDPAQLFTVFLPPLLFESAINLRLAPLRRDWLPIALYTLAGTALATLIVGGLLAWALRLPLAVTLVFGALISATDPISVISVFKRLGAGKRLTLIVEAESLFNDGVAVVLFTVMMAAAQGGHLSTLEGLGLFARLALGGVLLGAAIGAAASRVHYELDDHLVEITLTTAVAFGSYLCAEALHVSGVMAVVAAGMTLGNAGMQTAMSPGTRLAVMAFWEYAGFAVNSIVFLLIGIEVSSFHWGDQLEAALAAVGAGLAGRAAIYPLSWLANRLGAGVPRAWQPILFWGGLRGALSMALALGLGAGFPYRDTLIAGTFAVVLFSLLVQGLTLAPLLKRLGLAAVRAADPAGRRRLAAEIVACRAALSELERVRLREAHPNWSVELLVQGYRARLAELERAMEGLHPGYRSEEKEQAGWAHRQALAAEKSALQEAERLGWLDEDDWRDIAARIDAELIELGGR